MEVLSPSRRSAYTRRAAWPSHAQLGESGRRFGFSLLMIKSDTGDLSADRRSTAVSVLHAAIARAPALANGNVVARYRRVCPESLPPTLCVHALGGPFARRCGA